MDWLNKQTQTHVNRFPQIDFCDSGDSHMEAARKWTTERMPFTVRVVADERSLHKAVQIRHSAYRRHVPDLASRLVFVEDADHDAGSIVLLAESKLDGAPLGTMRIQTNRFGALGVQSSVTLPALLDGESLAEATRLGVCNGVMGSVVKTMLFKAYFVFCVQHDINKLVITARRPLDRQYEALLFDDVFEAKAYIPMRHVGNLPHRVMIFDVPSAQTRWRAANHPLYDFIFKIVHPDLDLALPIQTTMPNPAVVLQAPARREVAETEPLHSGAIA
jgi:hypothetical protein